MYKSIRRGIQANGEVLAQSVLSFAASTKRQGGRGETPWMNPGRGSKAQPPHAPGVPSGRMADVLLLWSTTLATNISGSPRALSGARDHMAGVLSSFPPARKSPLAPLPIRSGARSQKMI